MKYIQKYENFKPIKINSAKPFKIKKNIDTSIKHLHTRIKSLRKRLQNEKNPHNRKHSDMNKDKNDKIQKLKDLQFKQLKQQEYLKNNPIKENLENDDENLIDVLSSPEFKPEDILNHIGLEEKEYKIPNKYDSNWGDPEYTNDGVSMFIKSSKLEKLMGVEEGVINYIINFTSYYSGYEYYVDDSELDYLNSYLKTEVLEKIKELANLFDYNIDTDENGEINKFFNYIGLDDKLDDFKTEISYENESAIKDASKDLLKRIPFSLDSKHSNDFDLELYFDYDEMIEYMNKHKLDVKTIKEYLENIYEADEFSYDIEYEGGKLDFMGDFKDLNKIVIDIVDTYLNSPDEIFQNLIKCDNIELFKRKLDLAIFAYNYDIWIDHERKRLDLFEIAKHYNGKILEWFKTYDFQSKLIDDSDTEIYNALKVSGIINPEIEKEYGYLIDKDKYNI